MWGRVDKDPGWGNSRYGQPHMDNLNNHSVVMRINFGKASVLLPGDLEDVAIEGLVERFGASGALDVDLYKTGHHGAYNGTTPELVAAMTPAVAIISIGAAERRYPWTAWAYGHPRLALIQNLSKVSGRRTPLTVPIARKVKDFFEMEIPEAIYATAWDGTIVVELTAAGSIRVLNDPGAVTTPAAGGARHGGG
jgi:hypothetical protein